MEELQSRHRKEQRELQSRITQRKKNATKKTRKGVNDECEALQRALQDRQKTELDAVDPGSIVADMANLDVERPSADLETDKKGGSEAADAAVDARSSVPPRSETPAGTPDESSEQRPQDQPKKPNRQKARLARRVAEQEAQAAQAAEEAANLPDLREQEMSAMQRQMEKHGLQEISIRPDGHCLYSAIATVLPPDLVSTTANVKPYQIVRTSTADFISEHPDDFVAFLEEPLETYVRKIKDTAEWGGQLELQAIARVYGIQISVLQADGRVEEITPGTESKKDHVWLAYYRHSFGLGEHYNALKKAN